jgi:hypothetical protein
MYKFVYSLKIKTNLLISKQSDTFSRLVSFFDEAKFLVVSISNNLLEITNGKLSSLTLLIAGELLLLRSLATTAANGLGNNTASSPPSSLPRLLHRPMLSTSESTLDATSDTTCFTPTSRLDRRLEGLVAGRLAAATASEACGATVACGTSAGLVVLELRPPRASS